MYNKRVIGDKTSKVRKTFDLCKKWPCGEIGRNAIDLKSITHEVNTVGSNPTTARNRNYTTSTQSVLDNLWLTKCVIKISVHVGGSSLNMKAGEERVNIRQPQPSH